MDSKKYLEPDLQVFEKTVVEPSKPSSGELVIASIEAFDDNGKPLLRYKGARNRDVIAALTTVALHRSHIGRKVAISFVNQDFDQPIVIGLVKSHLDDLLDTMSVGEVEVTNEFQSDSDALITSIDQSNSQDGDIENQENNVTVDGSKITLEGKDEIVLKCGESSITLTKSGKILIRGKYLLNRSTGVNRIMGGSVQVN